MLWRTAPRYRASIVPDLVLTGDDTVHVTNRLHERTALIGLVPKFGAQSQGPQRRAAIRKALVCGVALTSVLAYAVQCSSNENALTRFKLRQ
jgi:hypothetical protein